MGRSIAPAVGVVGDVGLVLRDLIDALKEKGPARGATKAKLRLQQLARDKRKLDAEVAELSCSSQRPLHPLRVIGEVREVFPRQSTVAIDVGVLAQGMAGAYPYFKVFEPRSLIVPSSFYGMGFSASALPVAELVHPDRPAVGFVGDGSFQMVMQRSARCGRVPTARDMVRAQRPRPGSIWHGQRAGFGNRVIATTFEVQPDFAMIARACQCHGEKVEDPAEIRPALERALAAEPQRRAGADRLYRRQGESCRQHRLLRKTLSALPNSEDKKDRMPLLNFGQPVGGIIQVAYIVQDIQASMRDFTARLKVGPWFVSGPFVPPAGIYRGNPTKMRLTLAVGFSGHMSFELIEQHDELPSVYQEVIKSRGYGFHHWGVASDDLDAEVSRYVAMGYAPAFSDRSPRGYRVVYVDTSRDLPGMIEFMERTPALEARYTEMFLASVGWDGSDPVRRAK